MSAGRSCETAHSILGWQAGGSSAEDDSSATKSSINEIVTRVLVVDDDPIIRRYLRRVLSRHWDVDVATNARDAASMMAAKKYHAVVTDYEMPGENGLWLLAFCKQYFPSTLRILSSGSDDFQEDSFTPDDVVDHALPKPLNSERLCNILKDTLL